MAKFILAPCVEGELDEIWEFIAKDNPEAATRVVLAAYDTFQALAVNPGWGHPCTFRHKTLRNIRARNVQGFDSYLILYQEKSDGIDVLHVYHSARNITKLLKRK